MSSGGGMQLETLLLAVTPQNDVGSTRAAAASDATERAEALSLASLPADSPAPDLVGNLVTSGSGARVVAVAFCAVLAARAGLTPAPNSQLEASPVQLPTADTAVHAAGAMLCSRLQLVVREQPEVTAAVYTKGDASHRFKLRAWQALCVLVPFSPAEEQSGLLDDVLAALHRFDVASVKQYQERGAPLQNGSHACRL